MDRLRQTNSQLRDVLNERQIQAKQVQQPFIDLENLEKRVLQAQNLTWDAFIKAENKLTRLQGMCILLVRATDDRYNQIVSFHSLESSGRQKGN